MEQQDEGKRVDQERGPGQRTLRANVRCGRRGTKRRANEGRGGVTRTAKAEAKNPRSAIRNVVMHGWARFFA
jgi:ribosomal protein S12